MNYKVVETPKGYPDVLVYRETHSESVKILAIYQEKVADEWEEVEKCESIEFVGRNSAIAFVKGFDTAYALSWLDDQDFDTKTLYDV